MMNPWVAALSAADRRWEAGFSGVQLALPWGHEDEGKWASHSEVYRFSID